MIGPKLNSKINLIQDRLTDIREDWSETEGKGFCHCKNCKEEGVAYNGVCNELVSGCNRKNGNYGNNETEKAICDNVNQCATCLSVSIYTNTGCSIWIDTKVNGKAIFPNPQSVA